MSISSPSFQRFLIDQYAAGRRVVLIFDEAQNLSRESLEELRMFTNINSGKDELLQLILVGQPELRDIVLRPDLRQFAQRVSASYHLPAMDRETVRDYVEHRLKVAGAVRPIFTADAFDPIFEATRGVPRLVNQLCDFAMVYAFSEGQDRVDAATVQQVLDDGTFFGARRRRRRARVVAGPSAGVPALRGLVMKFYLSLLLRRLHWVLLFFAIGSAAGLTLAKILPPVYVSRATLIVETEQIPGDLAETTVRTGAIEQLQIIQQRILTRDRLIDMANRLKIYDQPGQTARPHGCRRDRRRPAPAHQDRHHRRRAGSRGPQQATIVTVSFEAPTAALAATVANEVVTMLLDENVSIRTAVAGQTLDFFASEVDRLEQELSKKGAEILAFQQANLDSLPDSLDFRRSQQSAAQERLQTVERDIAALHDRRAKLVALYEQTGAVGDAIPARQADAPSSASCRR